MKLGTIMRGMFALRESPIGIRPFLGDEIQNGMAMSVIFNNNKALARMNNHGNLLLFHSAVSTPRTTFLLASAATSTTRRAAFGFGSSAKTNNLNDAVTEDSTTTTLLLEKAQQRPTTDESDEAIIVLNQMLLEAIVRKDVPAYSSLCSEELTCIEPESHGQVVKGLDFHLYFLRQQDPLQGTNVNVVMTDVHVQRLGNDAAVVSYVRLQQQLDILSGGTPSVVKSSETRVWQKMHDNNTGLWKCVHFHRS